MFVTLLRRTLLITGGELELRSSPTERFTFWFGVGTSDVKTLDVLDEDNNYQSLNVAGPDYRLNGGLAYSIPVGAGEIYMTTSGRYTPEYHTNVLNPDPEALAYVQPSHFWLYGQAGWKSGNGRWEAFAYVKNALNAEIINNGLDLAAVIGSYVRAYEPPRWFGATFRYYWGN